MFRQRTDQAAPAVQVELLDDVLVVSGPDLDAVLGEVGARLGPDAEVLDAQRSIVGGLGGFFGREQFTVQARVNVDAPDEDAHTSTAPAEDAATPSAGERPALDGASFAAALAEALREVDEQIAIAELAPAAPTPTAPAAPTPVEAAPVEAGWDQGALLALSAPELSDDELRVQLAELVGSPPVLPDRGIVAVVGDPTDAVATAELLARRGGLDPSDVLVAAPEPVEGRPAWLTITSAADAGSRRDRWSKRPGLTVVVVALRPGLDGLRWTREVLDALRAEQVRLSVAGWRHVEEVLPRLSGLECVHAIDLCEPVDAAATAGFLGLPVPVATIAGRPATAQAWFDQLRDRVVAGSPATTSEPQPAEPRTTEPHLEGSRP